MVLKPGTTVAWIEIMTGCEIVAEWERRQKEGYYSSYAQSMADLAAMIDANNKKPEPVRCQDRPCRDGLDNSGNTYRERQIELRDAGFTAYNCDEVDEFPRWG